VTVYFVIYEELKYNTVVTHAHTRRNKTCTASILKSEVKHRYNLQAMC